MRRVRWRLKSFSTTIGAANGRYLDHCDRLCSRDHRAFGITGREQPSGFILTTVLGIVGAFLATWIGQMVGWYRLDQGAGFIGATVGAVVVLFIWNRLVAAKVIPDSGGGPR